MNEQRPISLRALVYCLLTGRDHVAEAAVPDTPEGFEGADLIIPDIVDAASKGRVTFYGKPTQTRFPINDDMFGDNPQVAIRKAVTVLRRPYVNDASDDAELAERTLSDSPEVVPPHVWHIDALAWEADHLLIWDSASLDSRFDVCRPRPQWVENPQMVQPLEKGVSVENNPFLQALPQYDPVQISGYSYLSCDASAVHAFEHAGLNEPQKRKASKAEPKKGGRKRKWDWDALNSAAETLLREGRVPTGTWKMVVQAAIEQAVLEGAEEKLVQASPDSWSTHLTRAKGSDLKERLDTASR